MSFCDSCCCCCCYEEYELKKDDSKAVNEADTVFDVEPTAPELEYIDDFVGPPLMLLKPMVSASTLSLRTASSVPLTPPPTPPPSPPMSSTSSIPRVTELNGALLSPPSSHLTPASTPLPSTPPSPKKTPIVEELEPPTLLLATASILKQPRLGHWNIREGAEAIRLFCHHLAEDYKEELYEYGPSPDYSTSQWENRKQSAEMADLELPYWIEESVRLCGTVPILEHIAKKHNLLPVDSQARFRLLQKQEDIDQPNYPDFNLYDLLDMLVTFAPDCLKQFENLENFMLRFKLGQQIRLLLIYCGENFEQEFYTAGPVPKTPEERASLLMVHQAAMDIRNSFYRLTFGPDYVSEPCTYACTTCQPCQSSVIELIELQERNKVEYMKNLPNEIKSLSDYLGGKKFFSGDRVNYPDFNIYDLLIVLKTYDPQCLDNFDNLRAYIVRFESIPAIKTYMNSSDYIHRPFTNTMAHWGYYFD
ncbi:unnamed protein product [Hydatigera taeniaeformis]|uniref:glutathione transferase n=1 Tax=Hydatigena taeniaeformis TaxID=6205 RepID=A0A0R3X365_HYDTA|nr:unnamed protein product [Hydatigera taeniaeformis]